MEAQRLFWWEKERERKKTDFPKVKSLKSKYLFITQAMTAKT